MRAAHETPAGPGRTLAAALLLLALVAAVFGPAVSHDFVNLDDPDYVLENPWVRGGMTLPAVRWAFTSFSASNWHPLTWLSHMLDVELFGLRPAGHHLTSIVLHWAAAVALFVVLRGATASVGASLAAAAFFAVHPLRVESVAWVAERKDVLGGLFWMLGLAAYLRLVRSPGPARLLTLSAVFALGLMAKPMLVTLPLALLALDYWPLGRARGARGAARLVAEKLPLLALSALSAAVTLRAQAAWDSIMPLDLVPPGERLANVAVALVAYLGKMLWPGPLSVYYPLVPGGPGAGTALAALALLAAVSAAVFRSRRRRPYLVTGWLWYLVTVAPVIGIVQVGGQAMADRYTYLPSIGITLGAVWLLRDLAAGSRRAGRITATAGAALLLAWCAVSISYLRLWENGVLLFRHALEVREANWMAHFALGSELANRGRVDEAVGHFRRAVELQPNFVDGNYNLGLAFDVLGDEGPAEASYRAAIALRPDFPEALNNLGVILSRREDEAAIACFRAALESRPDFPEARMNLARWLGDPARAGHPPAGLRPPLPPRGGR